MPIDATAVPAPRFHRSAPYRKILASDTGDAWAPDLYSYDEAAPIDIGCKPTVLRTRFILNFQQRATYAFSSRHASAKRHTILYRRYIRIALFFLL